MGAMATPSNAALRKKTPFFVSIFMIRDTRPLPELDHESSTSLLQLEDAREQWRVGDQFSVQIAKY